MLKILQLHVAIIVVLTLTNRSESTLMKAWQSQESLTIQSQLQHLRISIGSILHLHGKRRTFLHLVNCLLLYCPEALSQMSAEFYHEAKK